MFSALFSAVLFESAASNRRHCCMLLCLPGQHGTAHSGDAHSQFRLTADIHFRRSCITPWPRSVCKWCFSEHDRYGSSGDYELQHGRPERQHSAGEWFP